MLRELVIARDRTCVFPWCSRPARSCQLDRIRPHDPHDTDPDDAGTHTGNLACLCTFHHRLKTHGGWRYTMSAPGDYAWTSPHGHTYVRDHTGTPPPPTSTPPLTPPTPRRGHRHAWAQPRACTRPGARGRSLQA